MSSDSGLSKDRLNVYMPYRTDAPCYTFEVSRKEKVEELIKLIRKQQVLRDRAFAPTLVKCYLPVETPSERYKNVVEWLHTRHRDEMDMLVMEPIFPLEDYFPEGPASEAENRIDVIVLTDQMLSTILPYKPPVFSFRESEREKSEKEMLELVRTFLKKYDLKLREYLMGPYWNDFWAAPDPVDEQTKNFINGLKIPRISDNPVLLLHDLEKGLVDTTIVDKAFTYYPKRLVNSSGIGKTRFLFEGLTRHWGFYFTSKTSDESYRLSSKDVTDAINDISRSKGFTCFPGRLPGDEQTRAFKENDSIAQGHFSRILMVRFFVLNWFLNTIRETLPGRSVSEFRQHWLFLQLQPAALLGVDVFSELSAILKDNNMKSLFQPYRVDPYLSNLKSEFDMDRNFAVVLDDAQEALHELHESFPSLWMDKDRPVLIPLLTAWRQGLHLHRDALIIVSGTNPSIDIIRESDYYMPLSKPAYMFENVPSPFDNQDRQREYIMRYFPSHLAKTDSGKALLDRAWSNLRGRPRFTADLLTQLLKFSFQSPHKILDTYVETFCGLLPLDPLRVIEEDENLDIEAVKSSMRSIVRPDFSKIVTNSPAHKEIRRALYTWIVLLKYTKVDCAHRDSPRVLVDLGITRYDGYQYAQMDEPIVLLAAANLTDEASIR